MTENKIDEHATLSHLGQTGKQKENGWKKKRQVLCCLIQPFLQSLKSCLGQYNQWTSKHWGFNSASVIQTGVCDHHLKLLFIEGRDQYTECGITLTSLVVETGTIWASCGLLKKKILNFHIHTVTYATTHTHVSCMLACNFSKNQKENTQNQKTPWMRFYCYTEMPKWLNNI